MRQDPSNWTPASTERLLLRRLEPEDREDAVRIHADPRTNRYNPDDFSAAAAEVLFEMFLEHWNREGFGYWAVAERAAPQTVIGFTGLHLGRVDGREILNLYYRYDPAVWGRGYATEGAAEAVRRGLVHFPDVPVLARTNDLNRPSQHTALAAGLLRRADLDRRSGERLNVYFALGWPD
ncbi:GNAT family N-acetyltransferase [Arthrobacter sp. zg-Y820]|uniref:GNAT family N-acetyltransferase n=1 Tax=unclassified Arthrobacter TaxID=235627 RepID=UPI001E53BD7C|nr:MULTISPECIES: GNAT family N-acetyltransferase [unclassified Arthrobacter]MCC9196916.1 GNAT family N-acetyltransferase [Arthrobacter sp. zg-Y820]MDK1279780.1 GNAT family N-acetyltransferase [Arthrobacter sp. zg.Y820]WIB10967.1 GNAT family N-acetyltransferase [Arthrobacter sp. zg-Y820]